MTFSFFLNVSGLEFGDVMLGGTLCMESDSSKRKLDETNLTDDLKEPETKVQKVNNHSDVVSERDTKESEKQETETSDSTDSEQPGEKTQTVNGNEESAEDVSALLERRKFFFKRPKYSCEDFFGLIEESNRSGRKHCVLAWLCWRDPRRSVRCHRWCVCASSRWHPLPNKGTSPPTWGTLPHPLAGIILLGYRTVQKRASSSEA